MARKEYYLDGKKIPSVSSIKSLIFSPMDAIKYWAYNLGKEGKDLNSDEALTVGSLVHLCIEAELKGDEKAIDYLNGLGSDGELNEENTIYRQAKNSLDAWDIWARHSIKQKIASEKSFVSRENRFGGTIDSVIIDQDGDITIVDAKTSKAIYEDYIIQIAAYIMLWDENNKCKAKKGALIRVNKETGSVHTNIYLTEMLGPAMEAFLLARRLHELRKEIKKLS